MRSATKTMRIWRAAVLDARTLPEVADQGVSSHSPCLASRLTDRHDGIG